MRRGMFTLSGAPSTTSHLNIHVLSIFHYLGNPLNYYTLVFDLMKNMYSYNAFIYIHSINMKTPMKHGLCFNQSRNGCIHFWFICVWTHMMRVTARTCRWGVGGWWSVRPFIYFLFVCLFVFLLLFFEVVFKFKDVYVRINVYPGFHNLLSEMFTILFISYLYLTFIH